MPDAQAAAQRRNRLYWLVFAILLILLDQLSKYLADTQLVYGQPNALLPVLDITLHYNPGAAFSFLSDAGGWQRWFFAAIAIGASIGLTVWLSRVRADEKLLAIALPLIIGGALGNLYDRLIHGYVVDFLSFHAAGWYYPAFNVADIGITLGAIGLIWESVMGERRRKKAAHSSSS